MASSDEVARYESQQQMNRTKEGNETAKHRVGKTASNRVVSSRQSSSKSDDGGGQRDAVTKSRLGTAAAIKALCGKAAAKAGKTKAKKSTSGSASSSEGDGSIVKTPAGGSGLRCQTAMLTDKERNAPQSIASGDEKCHDVPYRHIPEKCTRVKQKWQNGVYCRDECGSGIIAKKFEFKHSRQVWCTTPLSMYQATIGELGRQILCREKIVPRDVKPGPPCNIAEYILPPCGGYYRKYDCIRPCEEEYVSYKQGRKLYRDRVERYWEPCQSKDQRVKGDINTFAHQNVYLGNKLRRRFNESIPCW